MITSFDILKFIIKSRIVYGRKESKRFQFDCMRNWSYRQILWQLNEAIKTNQIVVVTSQSAPSQILAVGLWKQEGLLYPTVTIQHVIADSLVTLKLLVRGVKERFSSETVFTASRHGFKRRWSKQQLLDFHLLN